MTLNTLDKNKNDIKLGLGHFSGVRHFKEPLRSGSHSDPSIKILDLVSLCHYHSGNPTPRQAENSY